MFPVAKIERVRQVQESLHFIKDLHALLVIRHHYPKGILRKLFPPWNSKLEELTPNIVIPCNITE